MGNEVEFTSTEAEGGQFGAEMRLLAKDKQIVESYDSSKESINYD